MPAPRLVVAALLFAATLAGSACSSNDATPGSARLLPLATCEDALAYVRQAALVRMNAEVDAQLAAYERGERCGYWGEDDTASPGGVPPPAPPPSAPPAEGGASEGTGTNNQVAGVDEADFVKNDGRYIYLAQNGVLRIIDAWPAPQTHELSVTPLPGTPRKLFVFGDRALVYVSVPAPEGPGGEDQFFPGSGGGECTYGYDCDFVGDGTATRLLIFDLTLREAPVLEREIGLSGSLIAARRVGSTVHTVVNHQRQIFPQLVYTPEENLCGYLDGSYHEDPQLPPHPYVMLARAAYQQLREQNAALIASQDLSGLIPRFSDSAFAATAQGAELCTGLYASSRPDGSTFTTIASVDLAADEPATMATIVGGGGAVYASAEALYLAVPHRPSGYGYYSGESTAADDSSCVHKFRISTNPADTAYLGSGTVRGRVLNQFAMDERDGLLRIATTSGHVPDPEVESQLTVLAPAGDALVPVGTLEHIAPTEDIRSVRFDGARVFVVTFKKTDPLFVFDLSRPSAPRQLGELHIPGFSTYMHMLDEDHLLSIGYDADDHGDFAYFDGVMLQIFDVSDMSAPTLAHKHVIGTRGSSSEALTNHLAFTYYPEHNLLAVPMTICEGGDDGQYGDTMSFSGLMVFDIDVGSGIGERGRVSHPAGEGVTCGNWWTHGSSEVKRSLFLEDFVYSLSDSELKVRSIDALGTGLVDLPLGGP